jgi:hypothetical protein
MGGLVRCGVQWRAALWFRAWLGDRECRLASVNLVSSFLLLPGLLDGRRDLVPPGFRDLSPGSQVHGRGDSKHRQTVSEGFA